MKKINLKILIVTSIVSILPIAIGLFFYNKLPDNIAIHFNINNVPDNFLIKPVFVFGIPVMMAILQIICCISSDLTDKNKEANKKAITVFKWIIPILSIVMYVITISFALNNNIDIRRIVMLILGIIFIIVGNYVPKTKGNSFQKIHVSDEKLTNKISILSGYMLVIDGILAIISILFEPIISAIVVGAFILEMIILYVYVYFKIK